MTCGEGMGDDTVTCYGLDSSQERPVRFDQHDSGRRRAAVAFSGDGRWFAFGGHPYAEVWERAAHRLHAALGRKPDHFYDWLAGTIALSFHGDRLASASRGYLAIRETSTSEIVRSADTGASALAFSPNDRRLGIAAGDRITILEIASGERRELTGNIGSGLGAAISPGGRYVVIVGSEGVRISDARSGHAMAVLMIRGCVFGPVFEPGEGWFAVAGYHTIDVCRLLPQVERWKNSLSASGPE